jgi:hypothetical protein
MGESMEARISLRIHTDWVLICGATITLLSRTTLVNPHNVRATNKRMIICLNCHLLPNLRPVLPPSWYAEFDFYKQDLPVH